MAEQLDEQEEDLDLDAKPASKKKVIILASVAGLLIIGGIVLALMLLGGDDEEEVTEEEVVEEVVVPETHYKPLEKMVITFSNPAGAKFLQVEMQFMAHDEAVLTAVEEHMPVIRNDLLILLAGQDSTKLKTLEGKETLRGDILAAVQKIVMENTGLDGPQAVYFTNFVMQ